MTEPGCSTLASEAQRAAGHEGESLRFDRQDLVRRGFAAEFLDRGVFDVAARADRSADAVRLNRHIGDD